MAANSLYARHHTRLQRFETKNRLPEDEPIEAGDAEVIILGMGRIGTEVYNIMSEKFDQVVLGIDSQSEVVTRHLQAERNVIRGDATDSDFWERVCPSTKVHLIILATTNHSTHLEVIEQLERFNNKKMIAALSRYDDEIEELKAEGVHVVFNLYSEAGVGYAEHVYQAFEQQSINNK
jgi:Trk K+ transport system NAD-binding subunit